MVDLSIVNLPEGNPADGSQFQLNNTPCVGGPTGFQVSIGIYVHDVITLLQLEQLKAYDGNLHDDIHLHP